MKYFIYIFLLIFCTSVQTQKQIYVSPQGSDKAEGTIKRPLKTIQTAIDRANKVENEEVKIFLREGEYELQKTIEVGKAAYDSLRIAAYNNEKVSISGGHRIKLNCMKKVVDPSVKSRLQPQVYKYIREIDLGKLGIHTYGLHSSGFGRPSSAAWTELFVNESPLQIARWPNDSTVLIGKVLQPGSNSDRRNWNAPKPVFCYLEDRPSSWKNAGDFWISGYFAHGFADDMIKVDHIDVANKSIHVAQQTVYGFMTGANFRRWHALNLVEELDCPGEYVIDEEKGKIYLYPTESIQTLHVSNIDEPLIALEHCSNVTLENLIFEYGRYIGIYLEDSHHVRVKGCTIRNMGGVAVSMGQGSITPSEQVRRTHASESGGNAASRQIGDLIGKVYSDVTFYRNSGTDNGVVGCYIYNVGAGGVSLGGGDRKTLIPANNFVENCKIHDYNRIEKSYRPAVWIDGVGCRVSNCDIYNAPSMAILFHGNNHLIEYCDITSVCTEVDDQAAIYYGRDPSERGNVIRYCYFHKLSPKNHVHATYHDDGACGGEVYGNIYWDAGKWPVLIGGGQDNHYKHNLFIESQCAIHIDNRLQNWATGMRLPGGIFDQRMKKVKYNQPPYSEAYPELVNYWENRPDYPQNNVIEGNLFYKIKDILDGQTQWGEFKNNWVTNNDPGFIDPQNPLKGFRSDAAIFQNIKDFPQLPFEKIGSNLP